MDINRLALGSAQFGMPYGISNKQGQTPSLEIKKILSLALANNIDTLDTATSYGDSEFFLGQYGIGPFKVITKLSVPSNNNLSLQAWFSDEIKKSFQRLNISTAYGLLLHRPTQLFEPFGDCLYSLLTDLKNNGQVKKIGVSINSIEELEILVQKYNFDIIQAPFNLIDRRLGKSGWLYKLKDHGIEIHTRSAFLQGLLLMPKEHLPNKFLLWSDLWDVWNNWLSDSGISPIAACLSYPLSFQEVDRVVFGVIKDNQLKEIIKSTNVTGINNLPELECNDENLINPSRWSLL